MIGRVSRLVLPSFALLSACGDDRGGSASDSGTGTTTGGTTAGATGSTAVVPTTGGSASGSTSTTGDEPVTPTGTATGSSSSSSSSSATTDASTTGEPIDPGGCVESVDGWCWTYPLPHGNRLHDVWADGAGSVWVVGEGGAIMRHDGEGWQTRGPSHIEGLRGVWGSGPDDVWAVGDFGLIVHFDGQTWTDVASPTDAWLRAIWGSAADDIWAGGDDGALLHYDGVAWTEFDPGFPILDVLSLWGFGPDDVWAGMFGVGGAVLHWDGTAWSYRSIDEPGSVTALWGRSPDDMYAALDQSVFLAHWTGGPAWEAIEIPVSPPMSAVAGNDTEVWAGGYHRTYHHDGVAWSPVPELGKSDIHGLERVGDDILAVGSRGVIGRMHAGAWTFEAGDPDTGIGRAFVGAWGRGEDDVWAVGSGAAHWDGTGWTFVDLDLGNRTFWDIGGAEGVLWGLVSDGGDSFLYRQEGDTWTEAVKLPSHSFGRTMWVADASTVWVSSLFFDGNMVRWDGQDFTFYDVPVAGLTAHAIAGLGPDDIWAVGEDERLLHFDGATWALVHQSMEPLGDTLRGVAPVGPDDVWCAGLNGDLYHWDGVTWTEHDATNWGFNAIWAEGPDSIWAVGGKDASPGVIFHHDGATWSRKVSGSGYPLLGLWGTGTGSVWAVGLEHSILVHRQ